MFATWITKTMDQLHEVVGWVGKIGSSTVL